MRYDFCDVKPIIVIGKIPFNNININENKLSRILASENMVLDCVCMVPFFLWFKKIVVIYSSFNLDTMVDEKVQHQGLNNYLLLD